MGIITTARKIQEVFTKKMTFELDLSSTLRKEQAFEAEVTALANISPCLSFPALPISPTHLAIFKPSPTPSAVMRWLSDTTLGPRTQETKWNPLWVTYSFHTEAGKCVPAQAPKHCHHNHAGPLGSIL